MNRQAITTDSRAAFYLKARGYGMTAAAAWESAARMKAKAAELAAAWEDAKAALAAAWAAEGKKEPRRYDPAGKELARLRAEERAASRAYFKAWGIVCGGGAYVGTWQKEPGHFFAQNPESLFRDFVTAEDVDSRLPRGWHTDPYQEKTAAGVVAQLPGRKGKARFVAGYCMGEDSGGATFDLSRIFEAPGEDAKEAKREAARAADSMAESAAEEEREYQTAREAGRQWAELKEEEARARAACLAILAERESAKAAAGGNLPAICRAIRASVAGHWQTIQDNREKRAELAAGDSESFYFYAGEERLREAFCDGAELAGFPA